MGHAQLVTDDPSKEYPAFLKKAQLATTPGAADGQPILLTMDTQSAAADLQKLIADRHITDIIDNYAEQYAELLLSKNAHLYRAKYAVQVASIADLLQTHYAGKEPWTLGSWVYFPWSRQLVHILAQKDFEDLRTIRNRDLITEAEQKQLFDYGVACFGMSVGSARALAMAISGISRKMKLIDGAVISGSNLNRILTGVASVGKSKAVTIGQQIYEMNPYSQVEYYDKALPDNMADIFDKPWPVKLVVDEIDDIEMKVRIRYEARKRKIPVVMATELGDTVMLDVERYDLEPNRELFHGMLDGIEELLDKPLENYREWTKHAVRIIDARNMPLKMQHSVLKIGTNIVTHPQLGSTVMVTGGLVAFAVKNIALGDNIMRSGRYVISLENTLLADHKTRHYKREHKKHTKVIHKATSAM
jgi:hypothetical protein